MSITCSVGLPRTLNIRCLYPQVFQCATRFGALTLGSCHAIITPHMAVVTERRAKKTMSRLEHSLLLQPVQDAMSLTPPDQPSGFSHSHAADITTSTTTPSPTDRLEHLTGTLTSQDPATQAHSNNNSSSKKRRAFKTKTAGELRKSSSTPHMRHLAIGTPGDVSPTNNKPRNKLGYHRTSVACGE